MYKIRKKAINFVAFIFRRVFYNTPIMHWKFTSYLYNKISTSMRVDLNKPVEFRNIKIYVDPLDKSYVPSLLVGFYEKTELDILDVLSAASKTFLDIGAHIGIYSLIAAKNNRDIKCYAFEPVLENQALLEKNILSMGLLKRVEIVRLAASDKVGSAKISLSATSGTHSLSLNHGGQYQIVKTTSVDHYCLNNKITPDLIKIDVEGHEANVLKGMVAVLKAQPTILIEYIPYLHSDMDKLGKIIRTLIKKYERCYVIDERLGTITPVNLDKVQNTKIYNLALVSNKSHIAAIENWRSK